MLNLLDIRQAQLADMAAVALVHVESWRQAYKGQMPQDVLDNLRVEDRQKKWESLYEKGFCEKSGLWLALDRGNTVGFISFGPARDTVKTDQGEIYALYLLSDYWGKGGGYALFKQAAGQMQKAGLARAFLWALETNRTALAAYARWGGVCDQHSFQNVAVGDKQLKEILVTFDFV